MQEKKLIFKKLVALMVTFLLLMLECMPILTNVSWAAEDYANSVEVKGYFSGENIENTTSLDCNADEGSVKLNFDIAVKDKGYFKSGILKFEDNLNFSVKEDSEVKIKDNQVKLQVLNQGEVQSVVIPIEFKRADVLKVTDLSKINKITFTGVFVDNDGNEHKIEKPLDLKLSWKEVTSTKIEYSILKNIDYEKDGENGKILQISVKCSGADKNNNLPIKNSKINIDIPEISGMEFTDAKVTVNKISYTQGRDDYNIDIDNISYGFDKNVLELDVLNAEEDGKLHNSFGEDSFIVTFLYKGVKDGEDVITNNINVAIENYAGNMEEQSVEVSYDLSEPVGNIVQYSRDNNEDSISNGYLMANTDEEKYSITYTKKDVINISRSDLISGLEIVDRDEYFVDADGNTFGTDTEDNMISVYKSTEFSRDNLVEYLGEDGKVTILNMNDEVVSEITFDMDTDDNGNYVVSYPDAISKIKILTSAPVLDGNISFLSTKEVNRVNYARDVVKNFTGLVNVSQGFATYNEGIVDDLGEVSSEIVVNPTVSRATVEMAQTEFPTTVVSEAVNLKIRLNNSDDSSDLYENPVFEIRLPQAIKEVTIKNTDLFYANGELQIANVETLIDGDNKVIRITLSGSQKSYNLNKETNGTIISLDMDLEIDEFTGNVSEMVEMYYYNVASKGYSNESEWKMLAGADNVSYGMNGYDGVEISYKAPEELVNGQTSETKDDNSGTAEDNGSGKVSSVKQGAETDLVEEGAEAKLATMDITVLNNTSKSYGNFKILGRIPFAGNKDVTTGEDLGTTVDTILDTEISSPNEEVPYAVYYSENGDATVDLYDENNGWRTDFYKMGAIKSYLILLNSDYVLTPNAKLEFSYDYVIPANLKAGDAFYGTYATYYEETSTNVSSNSSANKIGYETRKEARIEASMSMVSGMLTELADAEYEVTLKNTGDGAAEDIELTLNIPEGLAVKNLDADDLDGLLDENVATIDVPRIAGNSERSFIITFNVLSKKNNAGPIKLTGSVEGTNFEKVDFESDENTVLENSINMEDSIYYTPLILNAEFADYFTVYNSSDSVYNNVKIVKTFDSNFAILSVVNNSDANVQEEVDAQNNKITWTIKEFKPGDSLNYECNVKLVGSDSSTSMNIANINTTCDLNNGENIIEKGESITYYKPLVSIEKANNEIGYSNSDEELVYEYIVRNSGECPATSVNLNNIVSDNADIDYVKVVTDGAEMVYDLLDREDKSIPLYIPENSTIRILVSVKVKDSNKNYVYNAILLDNVAGMTKKNETYTLLEEDSSDENGYQVTGVAYVDSNKNQQYDNSEAAISGIIANLYDSETNELVTSAITDVSGRYWFTGLDKGVYYVKFNYDDSKYILSSEYASNVTSQVIDVGDNHLTDNIEIKDSSIANVDLGLADDGVFDLKLDAYVNKMTVQNSAESNEFVAENKKLAKVDIDPKLVDASKVMIEYIVEVTNQGTVPGSANKIIDYMPDGLEFDSLLNPDWYIDNDGNVCTKSLNGVIIEPNETKELKLVLIKNMTGENTGLVHNTFEIAEAINDKGIDDIDSTPGNKLIEDDLVYADSIIGISTGLGISIVPIVIVSIIAIIPIAFLIWKKIDERRYV